MEDRTAEYEEFRGSPSDDVVTWLAFPAGMRSSRMRRNCHSGSILLCGMLSAECDGTAGCTELPVLCERRVQAVAGNRIADGCLCVCDGALAGSEWRSDEFFSSIARGNGTGCRGLGQYLADVSGGVGVAGSWEGMYGEIPAGLRVLRVELFFISGDGVVIGLAIASGGGIGCRECGNGILFVYGCARKFHGVRRGGSDFEPEKSPGTYRRCDAHHQCCCDPGGICCVWPGIGCSRNYIHHDSDLGTGFVDQAPSAKSEGLNDTSRPQ